MTDLDTVIHQLVARQLTGFGRWAYGRYWSGKIEKDGTITIVSKGSEGGSTSGS